MACGAKADVLACFCSKCGNKLKAEASSSAAKKNLNKQTTKTEESDDGEELTDVHLSYIKEHYKAVAPLDLAKRLFPKKDITIKSKEAMKISEYTKMLRRSGGTGGDRVVGAEIEDEDDEGGGESLQEMPDINLTKLDVEIEPPRSNKVSMARIIEEAKAERGNS
jgi:hypothetical protein